MSTFKCEKCKKSIIDVPGKGYITGCEHYPLIQKPKYPGQKTERIISKDEIISIITEQISDQHCVFILGEEIKCKRNDCLSHWNEYIRSIL